MHLFGQPTPVVYVYTLHWMLLWLRAFCLLNFTAQYVIQPLLFLFLAHRR